MAVRGSPQGQRYGRHLRILRPRLARTDPDEKESLLKERDWNTLRLRVEGDHVQTWLNGEAMADLHDAKIGAAQGRIALQIHDGGGIKVQWRNLRLKTL